MKKQLDWMNQKESLEETTKNTIWLDEQTTWPDEKNHLTWLKKQCVLMKRQLGWMNQKMFDLKKQLKIQFDLRKKTTWLDEKTIWWKNHFDLMIVFFLNSEHCFFPCCVDNIASV